MKTDLPAFGDRIGCWTVMSVLQKIDGHKEIYCLCRCECGRENAVYLYNLINGKSQSCRSCAKLGQNLNDLTNQTFGSWRVKSRSDNRHGARYWTCVCCLCGMEKDVAGSNLASGRSISCGCQNNNFTNPETRLKTIVALEEYWAANPTRKANPEHGERMKQMFADGEIRRRTDSLSDEAVLAIRLSKETEEKIAEKYHTSIGTVSSIKRMQAYQNVKGSVPVLPRRSGRFVNVDRRKTLEEHLADAERLVQEHGALPNRTWMKANGYLTLYNFSRTKPEAFARFSRQPKESRVALKLGYGGKLRRFTDAQIIRIRKDTRHPTIVAAKYNVSAAMIRRIQSRKAYTDVI